MINSPWLVFTQSFHNFCEADVGGWVRFPASAWSNGFILLAGFIIFLLAFKNKQNYFKVFGGAVMLVGFMGFLYHATSTYIAGLLNLSSMFLVVWIIVVPVFWRLHLLRFKHYMFTIFVGSGLYSLIYIWNWNLGDALFFCTIGLTVILMAILIWHDKPKKIDRKLITGVVFFAAAFVFCNVDRQRIFCMPDNHVFQGEAIWHLFASIAVVFICLYLARFKMPEWRKGD